MHVASQSLNACSERRPKVILNVQWLRRSQLQSIWVNSLPIPHKIGQFDRVYTASSIDYWPCTAWSTIVLGGLALSLLLFSNDGNFYRHQWIIVQQNSATYTSMCTTPSESVHKLYIHVHVHVCLLMCVCTFIYDFMYEYVHRTCM